MKVWTEVSAVFSASHFDDVRQETHGHSYLVTARWPGDPPRDARVLQVKLEQTIAAMFDHKTLPPEWSRAEQMAAAVMSVLDCVWVRIERPLERLAVFAERE